MKEIKQIREYLKQLGNNDSKSEFYKFAFVYVNRLKNSDTIKVVLTNPSPIGYSDLVSNFEGFEECKNSYGFFKRYSK